MVKSIMKAAVIGSGIAGLATAIRLARQGFDVTVYEKNESPGGKISEIRMDGFRFDTGPSLFTLPELAEELFRLCGENMQDEIPYQRLETNCKYFYPDHSDFTFYHDKSRLEEELYSKQINDPGSVFRRLDESRELYELGAPVFIFTDFHKISNFNTPPYKRVATKLHKLQFFRTMHGANKKDFADERLIRIFDRYATYNGSSPYKAPATLNMIAHLENNIGAFFPRRGIYSLADGLHKLAVRNGVKFRFGTMAEEIIIEDKRVWGILSAGKRETYDIVVSDTDVKYLGRELIKNYPLKKRLERVESSSSALIFYWAVNKDFPELELHNIIFSKDYRTEFKELFSSKTISDDPTVYIFISSKVVNEDAMPGSENWFVMVNAPADNGQDWEKLISNTRKNVINKINEVLGTDIEKKITEEKIADPRSIERDTMSVGGALYGASSNSMISAFLRHPNSLKSVDNLYFVGGSVHPGGGIPLCLASAKIVCDEISARYAE